MNFLSKNLEKSVIQQLNAYLTTNNLHSDHQSAYKEGFSCETALYSLFDKVLWNMEKGRVTSIVALDLSAAFDTVDHGVMHNILQSKFGICDSALMWIDSYLSDRRMKVCI